VLDPSPMAAAPRPRFNGLGGDAVFWGHLLRSSIPYGLILPVVVVIGLILGYPLYWLVKLSTERYGLSS